ncbi:start control protein cdc10 [Podospora fimiseda]|uniref:Transcription factor SWI6 n=1 Tax=Podospora fimiseda TaxID=252190 RepID=A0AAN7GVK5_9PEZI|nr:start control protein cdc10 [Podospora fimiseda]
MQPPQVGGGSQQQPQQQNSQQSQSQQQPQHSQPSASQSFTSSQNAMSSYRQYTDPAPKPAVDNAMPIYSALYSNVNVYEMDVNGIAVMRRQGDGWLNATQILKVAGVEKGRRTKILEKEIQTGTHEKVQGGYGKYQGTWIPYERGVEVCQQYGVEEVLRKLLNHNRGQEHGVAIIDTPTKEQAMAAQRKRMYNASSQGERAGGLSGTFFKSISSTASHAITAISKARFDSPAPRNRNGPSRAPSFNRQSSLQQQENNNDSAQNSQQQQQQSFVSNYVPQPEAAFASQDPNQQIQVDGADQPPRKRQRVLTPANSYGGLTPVYTNQNNNYADAFPGSPTEPNESFVYSRQELEPEVQYGPGPLAPLPHDKSPEAEAKRSMLMSLFLSTTPPDEAQKNLLRTMTPQELDTPIDVQSHTALHWAATLARLPLLRALVEAGASPFRVNVLGETALMRACVVTNSMDHACFPELLDVLGATLDVKDGKGRTVLHHIAVTSAVQGRHVASRYYLESLLEWVVRQGSAPNSQNVGQGGLVAPRMSIGRFMSEVVNVQDESGDTALNIAARIGNRSIISQLLEVGADADIANQSGLKPRDFGIGGDGTNINGETGNTNGGHGSNGKSRENSDEVVNSISHLINESTCQFQSELKKKQDAVDSLHGALRTKSAQIGEAKQMVKTLQEKLNAQQLARQRVLNLSRACEEEEYRLLQLEQKHGRLDVKSENAWEMELQAILQETTRHRQQQVNGNGESGQHPHQQQQQNNNNNPASRLPSSKILKARSNALTARLAGTRKAVGELQKMSKERELKYRKLVSLCTRRPEAEVDQLLDTLTRAVESEKGELEIGRVRRFLGGVEGEVVA